MEKRKKLPIITLIIGILVLVAGLTFMLIKLLAAPKVKDAEYLIQIGQWKESGAEGVIWNFTSIGEGTLTTNNHTNDYKFTWSMDGDKLKIQTDWLYTLSNEYTYELNQNENTLTLTEGSNKINFQPASGVNTEVRKDN